MIKYVVIRYGYNAANQPMTNRLVLGEVEAETKEEALELVGQRWTWYHNQCFEVIPITEATAADLRDAAHAEAEARQVEIPIRKQEKKL